MDYGDSILGNSLLLFVYYLLGKENNQSRKIISTLVLLISYRKVANNYMNDTVQHGDKSHKTII